MTPLLDTARRGAAVLRSAVADGSLPAAAFGVAHADTGVVLAEAYGAAGWERSRQFTISALAGRIEQMYSDAIEAKAGGWPP